MGGRADGQTDGQGARGEVQPAPRGRQWGVIGLSHRGFLQPCDCGHLSAPSRGRAHPTCASAQLRCAGTPPPLALPGRGHAASSVGSPLTLGPW